MYNNNVKEVRTNNKMSVDYYRQFDVVWVDLPVVIGAKHIQSGTHPAVVLSSNSNNKSNSNLTVIPISSKVNKARHLPTHLYLNLELSKTLGLYKPSVIQAENTMPVDNSMILKKVGLLKDQKVSIILLKLILIIRLLNI